MDEPDPIVKAPPILLLNGGRPHMNHIGRRRMKLLSLLTVLP